MPYLIRANWTGIIPDPVRSGQAAFRQTASPLVGGGPITDISASMKTIANFWPYATTLFDYIRRAMPWQQPMTLANDEVYALTDYILAQNKLIGEDDTINAQTLPKVRMPNRDGFIVRFPDAM
jgi:cytochrome c